MISNKELEIFKEKTDKYVKRMSGDFIFDHFGIKVPDRNTYKNIKKDYPDTYNEVTLSGRRIATLIGEYTIELIEPKPGETVTKVFIDHVSYRVNNYNRVREIYKNVLTEFEFGKTRGFKVQSGKYIIEIRNNKLTDSKGDI